MPERQTSPAEVSPDDVDASSPDGAPSEQPPAGPAGSTGGSAGAAPSPSGQGASTALPPGPPEAGASAGPPDPTPAPPPSEPVSSVSASAASTDVRTPPAEPGTPPAAPEPAPADAPPAADPQATVPVGAPVPGPPADPGAERPTEILPLRGEATDELAHADAPTVVVPGVAKPDDPQPDPPTDGSDAPTELLSVAGLRALGRRRRRALVITGAVVVLLAALYGLDLALSSGTVPRGVTVAGQEVGGLSRPEAEQRVRAAVGPRTTRPVAVAAGDVTSEIDPRAAGLAVDWTATIEQAGEQPLNPITRLRSFFTHREVGVASTVDGDALDPALQQLVPLVNRPPVEGSVRFDGVTPVPVPPVAGRELDLAAARQVLQRDWTNGTVVRLPLRVLEPTTTADDVTSAIADLATPAVSGPVTVVGEKVTGTITPEVIAKALSFRPDPSRGLVPELDKGVVQDAVDPQLASSEQPGRDASLRFAGGKPVVTPSQDGRGVDYDATLKDLLAVLTKTGAERRITAVYAPQPAKLTTEQLKGLGIVGVVGEFTTRGFASDSGQNIRRAAQVINGSIVRPGETFSLNGATEPRDAAHGYVEAGIISDGHASRGVGGGVSQLATTLYNAAYFAGMTDVTHKPHSFYISRYPPGREATVFEGAIDMRFRNDSPTGVLVETVWTPVSLTVRLYGTKHYDVTSSTGPRTSRTEPTKVEVPDGQPCVASSGSPGFTVTDTRTLRDVKSGRVKTEKRTTKYNPSPIVSCGSD